MVKLKAEDPPPIIRDADDAVGVALAHPRQVDGIAVRADERDLITAADHVGVLHHLGRLAEEGVQKGVVALGDLADGGLLHLLLRRPGVGGEELAVLQKSLDAEVVVRQHPDVVERLAQLRRVSPPAGRDGEDLLVGHRPPRRQETSDRSLGLPCDLHRRGDVGLHDALLDADPRCPLLEGAQHLHQLFCHPLGEVDRYLGPQPDAPHLLKALPLLPLFVVSALRLRHLDDGIKDLGELAGAVHERIATGDEDVAEVGVISKVLHVELEQLGPALLRRELLQLEVEAPRLKIVHPLTVCAESPTGAPHRVGDEDRHVGVTAMDVVRRQDPPGGVRLADLDHILLLPRHDAAELIDQILAVEQVGANGGITSWMLLPLEGTGVDEGEEVRGGEDRDSLLLGRAHDGELLLGEAVVQVGVERLAVPDSVIQMEAIIIPPGPDLGVLLLFTRPRSERIALVLFLLIFDAFGQEGDDALLVLSSPGEDLAVEAAGVALHPLLHDGTRRDIPALLAADLGEQVGHVLGEVGRAVALLAAQHRPQVGDGAGDHHLTMEVLVDELVSLVIEVVEDAHVGHRRGDELVVVLLALLLTGIVGPRLRVVVLHDGGNVLAQRFDESRI